MFLGYDNRRPPEERGARHPQPVRRTIWDAAGRIFLSSPDVGVLEREAVARAIDSGWVAPIGPELEEFEFDIAAMTGSKAVVGLSSGTAALHLALLVAGVGPGDEVIVPTFTFAATVNAVTYVGATPRFIDSEPTSWNMSPELLAAELDAARSRGRMPAAVIVVDLYGQCADFDEIRPLCEAHGIPIIEDAAEAVGATYKGTAAGTLGDSGVYSFNGNKIVTTSGGGAFLSPDERVADRVRYLSTQARQPTLHHEHTETGYNYRLSNLLAAIGRVQLARLPAMSARRFEINRAYRETLGGLDGVSFMPIAPWGGWNGWLTCLTFDDASSRDRIITSLARSGIESRPLWKPMHLQPVFTEAPARLDGTSDRLYSHGLCLPSSSALTDGEVCRVIAGVTTALVG